MVLVGTWQQLPCLLVSIMELIRKEDHWKKFAAIASVRYVFSIGEQAVALPSFCSHVVPMDGPVEARRSNS